MRGGLAGRIGGLVSEVWKHQCLVQDGQRLVVVAVIHHHAEGVFGGADDSTESNITSSQRFEGPTGHPGLLQKAGADDRNDTGCAGEFNLEAVRFEIVEEFSDIGFLGHEGPLVASGRHGRHETAMRNRGHCAGGERLVAG